MKNQLALITELIVGNESLNSQNNHICFGLATAKALVLCSFFSR